MRIRSVDFELLADGTERPVAEEPDGANAELESAVAARRLIEARLAFYEPTSDAGHLTFTPEGAVVRRLMEQRLAGLVRELTDAREICTPILYRADAPGVAEESAPFIDQMYTVGTDKGASLLLRPGGDYGCFAAARTLHRTEQNRPMRLFEIGPSFRRLQRGKLAGLRAARAFTILDYHAFCVDETELWSEWTALIAAQAAAIAALDMRATLNLEIVADYWASHKAKICEALAISELTATITLLDTPRGYWMLQHRFYLPGGVGVMDGQHDYVNGARYGIVSNPGGRPLLICHGCWGTVERWIVQQLTVDRGGLPYWLAPVQLALLPCSPAGAAWAAARRSEHRHRHRIAVMGGPHKLAARLKRANDGLNWAFAVIGDRETAPDAPIEFKRPTGTPEHCCWSDWLAAAERRVEGRPTVPFAC